MDKKNYIKPEIERVAIFDPQSVFFGLGKTPLCLMEFGNKE
jgi:hypothetical protein